MKKEEKEAGGGFAREGGTEGQRPPGLLIRGGADIPQSRVTWPTSRPSGGVAFFGGEIEHRVMDS